MLNKANVDRLWSFHNAVVQAEIQLSYAHLHNENAVDHWTTQVTKARQRLAAFIKANALPDVVHHTKDKKPKYHRPTFKASNYVDLQP